jgi:hypothetical protein
MFAFSTSPTPLLFLVAHHFNKPSKKTPKSGPLILPIQWNTLDMKRILKQKINITCELWVKPIKSSAKRNKWFAKPINSPLKPNKTTLELIKSCSKPIKTSISIF